MPGNKVCHKCNEIKLLDSFNKLKASADGLQRYCRNCANAANRIRRKCYNLISREEVIDKYPMKICNICKINKSRTYFNIDNYNKDGLVLQCKACQLIVRILNN